MNNTDKLYERRKKSVPNALGIFNPSSIQSAKGAIIIDADGRELIDFAGGIKQAIEKTHAYLKANQLDLKIEIETRNLDEVKQVLAVGGVNRIMLDNFTPDLIKQAVDLINGAYETEASGGITINTITDFAKAGVDFISIGALTHSAKSIDLSLKVS